MINAAWRFHIYIICGSVFVSYRMQFCFTWWRSAAECRVSKWKKKINFQPTYLRVGVRAAEVNHTNIYYDNLIQPFKTGEYYSFDVMGVLPKPHASTIISIFLGSKMVKQRLAKRFVYEYLCALSNMRAKINRVMNWTFKYSPAQYRNLKSFTIAAATAKTTATFATTTTNVTCSYK